MRRFTRLTISAFCVVALAGPGGSRALGARTGSPFGYAIAAVGFKSYFVFDTRPGHTVRGTLRVVSLTPGAKTILLAPVDVSTAATGELQYGNRSPRGEGRWLTLAKRTAQLSDAGSANVSFAVRVPRTARAGDHFLGIVALDRRVLSRSGHGTGAIRLRLIPRLAMTVELVLPGPRTSELAVGRARIEVAPSGASLAIPISNPGNTLIPATTGSVTVSQGSTPLFSQGIDLAAFVPKTAISYHVPWLGTPVQGTYRVKGDMRPSDAQHIEFDQTVTFGARAIRQFRRQTGRQATESAGTPAILIVILALALAVATAFGVAYARTRRQLHGRE